MAEVSGDAMTNKERILAALGREQPDTVPIWELAFNEASIIGLAKNFTEEENLPEPKLVMDMTDEERFKLIQGFITFARELDLDSVTTLSLAPREKIDDEHLRDSFGVVMHMSEWGEPYPVKGPINGRDDLDKYEMRKPEDNDYLLLKVMRATFPDKAIAYQSPATFKYSWSLRGTMDKLLMDYILDPGLAHDLARMVTDFCIELVEGAINEGADFIALDGDLAFNPGPLMSPAHYDEFIGPYHKEIVDKAHELGVKIIKHSDGNLLPLFPSLVEAGFDGIHPIQPQCMDIGQVKREWGDKICILGNIDCSYLLVFESPEEVDQSVKETIEIAAPGGGYIITSSNSIHPGVKPENYIAMVRAARKYGKYPELTKT